MRWIFNGLMLTGAVCGYIIVGSLLKLENTWEHQGPGVVSYGEDSEFSKRVPESEYKRQHYGEAGFMLVIGCFIWGIVANSARARDAERKAHIDYLNASRDAVFARFSAFAKALDSAQREHAYKHADSSDEYQIAQSKADGALYMYRASQQPTE